MPTQAERRTETTAAILRAARDLFGDKGFAAVSIDDVAAAAGVTKGGLYHHFASKEALFLRVLEGVQEALLGLEIPPPDQDPPDLAERLATSVRAYLVAATRAGVRQILLIDGPVVVGWRKWREVDERVFGAMSRFAMRQIRGPSASEAEVEALARLVMGAVMEAALACAVAADPEATARELASALRLMIAGLVAPGR